MAEAPLPLRIIFLDIDGVICCNSMGRLEDKKMRILQGVAQAAQAKIVLSTDWRRHPQLKTQLIHALRSLGMDVIGATPCRPNWQAVRPQEITSWLHAYHETAGTAERPYVESYVAIDDRPLLAEQGGEQLRGHFVHTRVSVGITDRAAQRMLELLTEPEPGAVPIPGLPAHMMQAVGYPPPMVTASAEQRRAPPSSSLLQNGTPGVGKPNTPGGRQSGPATSAASAARAAAAVNGGGKGGSGAAVVSQLLGGNGRPPTAGAGGGTTVGELSYGMSNLGAPSLAGRGSTPGGRYPPPLPTLGSRGGSAVSAGRAALGGSIGSDGRVPMSRRPVQPQGALRIGGGGARVGGPSTFGNERASRARPGGVE